MPAFFGKDNAPGRDLARRGQHGLCLFKDALTDFLALGVEVIEFTGKGLGFLAVTCYQQLYGKHGVIQASSGIDARSNAKPNGVTRNGGTFPRRRLDQGAQSHKRRIGDFLESPANNLPVFPYKGHHIRYRCHGSKFDQICPKRTFGMKMLPQGLTELKSHPTAADALFWV